MSTPQESVRRPSAGRTRPGPQNRGPGAGPITPGPEQPGGEAAPANAGAAAGPWRRAWRQLRRDRAAVCAFSVVAVLVMVAVAAPLLARLGGWSPDEFDENAIDPYLGGMPRGSFGGISAQHWLGV